MHSDVGLTEFEFRESDHLGLLLPPQRHLRHLTSIQVRNLTPYPARDAIASVLAQAFLSANRAMDDADLEFFRRRNRRLSVSFALPDGVYAEETLVASSHKANQRSSFGEWSTSRVKTNSRRDIPDTSVPSNRTAYSIPCENLHSTQATSVSPFINDMRSYSNNAASNLPYSNVLETRYSQHDLERTIRPRLMRTFMTVAENFRGKTRSIICTDLQLDRLPMASLTDQSRIGESLNTSTRYSYQSLHFRSMSVDNTINLESNATSNVDKFVSKFTFTDPHFQPIKRTVPPVSPDIPIYISPIHSPSTNPQFILDAGQRDIASWANFSATKIIVTLWGESTVYRNQLKDENKTVDKQANGTAATFQSICSWDVDLFDLIPLPKSFPLDSVQLPSNSLLLALSTSETLFYVPLRRYISTDLLDVFGYDLSSEGTLFSRSATSVTPLQERSGVKIEETNSSQILKIREKKSVSYQDLVNLVTLWGCILDTEMSLRKLVIRIDRSLEEDSIGLLTRDISHREHKINLIRGHLGDVQDASDSCLFSMQSRRSDLKARRMLLSNARSLHETAIETEFSIGTLIAQQRNLHKTLKDRIHRKRASLLSTLASIYPIELISPPDLLFTILSVPLPIPSNTTDPAPPLVLSSFKGITEECIATALGYAAHVLRLMATYLSYILIYPVTYIGSKSVIKDPISYMVGPRTFPLYSAGVETYRFEYAVFLLNKNIELLMAEKDLRFLDARHTLPNIKNLLLTLTSGDLQHQKSTNSATSDLDMDSSLSRSHANATSLEIGSIASVSESDSSTAALSLGSGNSLAPLPRMRSYLGLLPLASMFRIRDPTTTNKKDTKSPEGFAANFVESNKKDGDESLPRKLKAETEDDQRTVRGITILGDLHELGNADGLDNIAPVNN